MDTSPITTRSTELTPPLLRRAALWPQESLASLLERLTQLNFYPHRGLLQTLGRKRLADVSLEDDIAHPAGLGTFQQLAHLTRLTLDELYAASEQRFADQPGPLEQILEPVPWLDHTTRPPLEPRWAHDHLRPDDAVQFCPMCLKAAAYHRLNWIPCAVAICLEHRCLLTDRCARCWHRTTVADLVSGRCPVCQADLRRVRPTSIAHDRLGLRSQQAIQAWFNVATPPAEALVACHLPQVSPPALYHLLQLIARQLLKGQAEWPNLPRPLNGLANSIAAEIQPRQRLTPDQAYCLYRSAFAGLLDWPEGLHRLLDAYGGCDETRSSTPTRSRCLQRVQRDWLNSDWAGSPLAFVQRDVLDYVLKRGLTLSAVALNRLQDVPWFVDRTDLWTEERTAHVLDLSPADLRRFAKRGPLAHAYWPHSKTHLVRFKRAEIMAVKQRWTAGWSLEDAGSWLGVRTEDVRRLVEVGVLSAHGAVTEAEADQGLFDPKTVRDFFRQITACLQPYPEARRDLILMIDAVSEVGDLGVDFAVLLQSVLAGQVTAYQRVPEIASLYHLYFIQLTIFALPDQLYAARGWVSGDRFTHDYGLAPTLIREWLAAGLIQPAVSFDRRLYFDQQQLQDLAAQHGYVSPTTRRTRKRRT